MINKEINQLLKSCITLFLKRPMLFIFPVAGCVFFCMFLIALAYILQWEAGFVENPNVVGAGEIMMSYFKIDVDFLSSRLWLLIPLLVIVATVHGLLLSAFCVSIKKAFNQQAIEPLSVFFRTIRNIFPITRGTVYYFGKGVFHPSLNNVSKYFSSVFFRLHAGAKDHSDSSVVTFEHSLPLLENIPLELWHKLKKAFMVFLTILFIGLTSMGVMIVVFLPDIPYIYTMAVVCVLGLLGLCFTLGILRVYSVALYIYMTEGVIPSSDFTELFD